MFGARMKLLNSQLQVGMLTYETQLVSLYFSNLQSVGTQSAVLASLAFGAVNNLYFFDTIPSTGWSYLYRIFYTISLISSLTSIANSTISSMMQPEHGLLGNLWLVSMNHICAVVAKTLLPFILSIDD